jgi:hypothetical protein
MAKLAGPSSAMNATSNGVTKAVSAKSRNGGWVSVAVRHEHSHGDQVCFQGLSATLTEKRHDDDLVPVKYEPGVGIDRPALHS